MGNLNLSQLTVDWHASGRPHKIRGDMPLPKSKSTEAAISEFLTSNAEELRLGIDARSLRLVHKTETPTRVVYRYQQVIGDIPVHDSYVVVQTDLKNTIKQIEYGNLTDLVSVPAAKGKGIGPKAAYELALKSLGKVSLRKTRPQPSRVSFRRIGV